MDVFSKEKRSSVMSNIHGGGNKDTELVLIEIFKEYEIKGWRRKQKIFGKPDFTFWKQRVVIFVDGCFWHGCPLHATMPKNNEEFWVSKLNKNKERDIYVFNQLIERYWRVIRVWEHDLKNHAAVASLIKQALIEK